jgi:hypothetical protein
MLLTLFVLRTERVGATALARGPAGAPPSGDVPPGAFALDNHRQHDSS